MRRMLGILLVVGAPAGTLAANEAARRTFNASEARTWAVTEAVLKHLGWEIDKADRTIGWITTKSRMLEGGDYGVYAKGVGVERSLFNRERILWMDKDEPVAKKDQDVEKSLLESIGKSL